MYGIKTIFIMTLKSKRSKNGFINMKFYRLIEKIAMYRQNQFYEVIGGLLDCSAIDNEDNV